MTDEVTVAELVAREGLVWPAVDPSRGPRHLIEEEPPNLVRAYVLPRQENHG